MAYQIDSSKCCACGSCVGECPVGAIVEGDTYTIKADECISCGACCDSCPVDAIAEE